jgi:drug/metabolite transporter (DMT)-like permease
MTDAGTLVALAAVAAAALCSGTALVLQARAAREGSAADAVRVDLVWRLVRNRTYLLALVLVAAGFALAAVALRQLPVFVVQAGRASSVAVAAVLAQHLLGTRMRRAEWAGIGVLVLGLVLLAGSTTSARSVALVHGGLLLPLLVTAVAALGVWTASRPPSRARGLVLATLAGVGFAALAAGVHVLDSLAPLALLGSATAWSAAVGGGLGLLLTALAFQRAPAVAVSALVTGTETVLGAALGVLLAGDRAAAGRTVLAVLGVLAVLAGSAAVARFGSPDALSADPARPAEPATR